MKQFIYKFLFLFYKYYDQGSTKSIAHESAIIALTMVFIINTLSVVFWLDIDKKIGFDTFEISRGLKYLIGIGLVIPIVFVLKKVFPRDEILKIHMDKKTMRVGYFLIVAYIILSTVILLLAAS